MSARIRAHLNGDRGEGPISVMIGVTVFMLLAFALVPALTAFTHLTGSNAHLRRVGKELSALVDQQRRLPWTALDPNAAPSTKTVMLDDIPVPVTTWVTTTGALRVVHMAAPMPTSKDVCSDPAALGAHCVVRTAMVAAPAAAVLPSSSAGVTFTSASSPTATGATTVKGANLATLTAVSGPTRVYVIGYNAAATTAGATFSRLGVYSAGIPRTHLDLDADGTGWVFGSAVVCPSTVWKGAGTGTALVATGTSGLTLSKVVIRTAPDTGTNRC